MRIYRSEYRLCYAHRVWNPSYSNDDACRMIHGHTADLSVDVEYGGGTDSHREVESTIGEVLKFMGENVYNRFIIDHADPMFYTLVASMYECLAQEFKMDINVYTHNFFVPITIPNTTHVIAHKVNLSPFEKSRNSPIYDILRSYLITDFCPGSANLTKWFYDMVNSRITQIEAKLLHVEWSSTPNRKIIYKPK